MNIVTIVILLSLLEELPELPEYTRANRQAQRDRQIARNKALENSRFGGGIWFGKPYHVEVHKRFQHPELEGKYVSYHNGQVYDKKQDGRFAEFNFGGHRRHSKWAKKAHPSGADYLGKLRWEDELRDYFDS